MRAILALAMMCAALVVPAQAQAQAIDCQPWVDLIRALEDGSDPRAVVTLADVGQNTGCYASFLARAAQDDASAFGRALKRFESARSDKQSGASASGTGSTTIVAQGATARVLSVAAEYGALTQSARDGVVTVRGNLAGLPAALVNQDVFPYCDGSATASQFCVQSSLLSVLRRASFGVSFDPSRGQGVTATPSGTSQAGSQPVTFTASQGEISAINVRIDLVNNRDAMSRAFQDAWAAKVGPALQARARDVSSAGDVLDDISKLAGYSAWQASTVKALQQAGRDRGAIETEFVAALWRLSELATQVRDIGPRLDELRAAFSRLALAQDQLIDSLAERHILALEYTQNRPAGAPRTSNVRGILDYPFSKTTKVVANAALTFYETRPANPEVGGRVRDAQFGLQVDHGLADSAIGPAVLSGAVYYQYQRAASVLTVDPATPLPGVTFTGLPDGAKEVFTKTGDIVLAQVKLSLTPNEKSLTIPFSVTWSNRTELIDKPAWRAQVGVNYNIDALFTALSGR